MSYCFKLSRRVARLRAPVFVSFLLAALVGCGNHDSLSSDSSTDPGQIDDGSGIPDGSGINDVEIIDVDDEMSVPEESTPYTEPVGATPTLASVTFAGGIPMGVSNQPTDWFGTRYNGALRNIWPEFLMSHLSAIKAKGGKVVLMFAGTESYYKDSDGHFSLSKWKARVDRFRKVNFSSYVNDGTIVGHYLIDEPYDPYNWNGRPVGGATVEEMAKYSKSIWPNLTTIVRAEPYNVKWSGVYRYLDAAWAQYTYPKGDVTKYINRNVTEAKNMGLQLIVGLNMIKGGPNHSKMTSTQIKSWGGTLLSSTYPCAFISWQYNSTYLLTSSIKDAMTYLRNKAQNRSLKTCK